MLQLTAVFTHPANVTDGYRTDGFAIAVDEKKIDVHYTVDIFHYSSEFLWHWL